jgi:FdhD protein
LHAIYGRGCLTAMERQLASGQRRVISFFDSVKVRTVDLATVEAFDPGLMTFFNANTPEAAQAAARLLEAARVPSAAEADPIPDGSIGRSDNRPSPILVREAATRRKR